MTSWHNAQISTLMLIGVGLGNMIPKSQAVSKLSNRTEKERVCLKLNG